MTAKTDGATPSRQWMPVTSWVLRGLLAALFLYAGIIKLTGQSMMVEEFAHVGLGQWFRYFTGVLEVTGAVGLLMPRTSLIGACLLLLVDAGAGVAQVAILHGDWIHTAVIGLLLGGVLYLQRRQRTA